MIPISAHHKRRDVLKGLSLGAGSLLLAPLMSRLMAADNPNKTITAPRFLFVLEGSGCHPNQIAPLGIPHKKRTERKQFERFALGNDVSLPPALEPLTAHKNKINIIQGLSGKVAGGGHSGNQGVLGSYNAFTGRRIAGPTIDCALGQLFPGILPSITLGISATNDAIGFNCSAIAANKPQATLFRPDQAYTRLFGSVAKDQSSTLFKARSTLLDFMSNDVKNAQKALGQAGREQLDAYLESFEDLAQIDHRMAANSAQLKSALPTINEKYSSESRTHRLEAHFQLASAAMISGLTNSITIASGVGFNHFDIVFDDIDFGGKKSNGGFKVGGKHGIGHEVGFPEKPNLTSDGYGVQIAIRRFHMQQIADFLDRLAKIPEGSGTMADNTVVLYLSDAAETHHSRMVEWPMVMIGDLKGKIKSGQLLSYPDYVANGHFTTARLFSSLLYAAGKKQDVFGEMNLDLDKAMQIGPLSSVLA